MNKLIKALRKKKLSTRLYWCVFASSLFFVFFMTVWQLFDEYKSGLEEIEKSFVQIEKGYLPTILKSTWTLDYEHLEMLLAGALQLPGVEYLEVVELRGGEMLAIAKAGQVSVKNSLTRSFSMSNGGDSPFGKLTVFARKDMLWQRTWNKAPWIFAEQVIKIFAITLVFLLIVYFIVLRYLNQIIEHFKSNSLKQDYSPLVIENVDSSPEEDEFLWIAAFIKRLQESLDRNISEFAKAEKIIKENEERFELAMRGANDGLWDRDMQTGKVYYSPRWKSMLGYNEDEILDSHTEWMGRLHPDDVDRVRFHTDEYKDGRRDVYEIEFRLRHKQGHYVHILSRGFGVRDEAGVCVRTVGTHIDISQRKKVEEELRVSQEKFKTLFEQAGDGIVIIDWETGRIEEFNERAHLNLQYSREQFAQLNLRDLEANDIVANSRANYLQLTEHGVGVFETKHRTRLGAIQDVHVSARKVSVSGETRILCVLTDITSLKSAQKEIKKLNKELEIRVKERTTELLDANKELESFSYSVSHDLRAPIRHIMGFSTLLVGELEQYLNDQTRHYLETVIDSSKKMSMLIDSLLQFSRMSRTAITVTDIDMGKVVENVMNYAKMANKDRIIEWKIHSLPMAKGDLVLVVQVLENLISNAVKYSARVSVARIEIGAIEDVGSPVVYYVKDNGVGFDMLYVEQAFEVFHRLHRVEEFEGIGIGLSLVKRIIQRHGGRVWAEGEVDIGATFYFTLAP